MGSKTAGWNFRIAQVFPLNPSRRPSPNAYHFKVHLRPPTPAKVDPPGGMRLIGSISRNRSLLNCYRQPSQPQPLREAATGNSTEKDVRSLFRGLAPANL